MLVGLDTCVGNQRDLARVSDLHARDQRDDLVVERSGVACGFPTSTSVLRSCAFAQVSHWSSSIRRGTSTTSWRAFRSYSNQRWSPNPPPGPHLHKPWMRPGPVLALAPCLSVAR